MPLYAAFEDIRLAISKEILRDLTDDAEDTQADVDVVDAGIDRAESVVHMALYKAGYTVPVALPIPAGAEVIKTIVIWLAVCEISARRGVLPTEYQKNCDYYRDLLSKIALRTMLIPLPETSLSMPASTTIDQEKVFTRTKLDHSGDSLNEDEAGSLDVP